jgi:exonuclease SbcC
MEELKRAVQELTDKINGVISSRSNLKESFDDLNSKKNKRAELKAGLRSLERQCGEAALESSEISKAIVALGEIRHDPERLATIQARFDEILPSIEEHKLLAFKLKDLPGIEAELESLKAEILRSDQRLMDLGQDIKELGYAESKYLDKRKKLTELKPSHDKFILLSQRVLEIPVLEDRIRGGRADLEKLEHTVTVLGKSIEALGFDPAEYESLLEESRSLSQAEEKANKINLKVATEAEIKERLRETAVSLSELQSELILGKEQLNALGYDEAQHNAARQGLTEADVGLEAARKEASNRQVHLGVLEAELARFRKDAKRKKEFERELAVLDRRLEVVDTTRSLVNRFMDHILVRIRSEIVRIAGEILEEVSGKYSLLKIDDDFNIMVEDEGEYYPISRYSGGEVDMIAVSVRVAISEYLMRFCRDGPGYSFLILDEVFGSQDLEHREKMINMLRSLEERFPQIIAISHFSDVQGQFDNTIQVVEDEMGNSRVEVV